MTTGKNESPALALLIVTITFAGMTIIAARVIDLHFTVGPWLVHHWLAWTGALFILLFTPHFYARLRRDRANNSALLRMHMYGGLLAWGCASLHFMQHMVRLVLAMSNPAQPHPTPGTGIVLYIALTLSVLTGLLIRHRLASKALREWYFIHGGAAVTFAITVVVHIVITLKKILTPPL